VVLAIQLEVEVEELQLLASERGAVALEQWELRAMVPDHPAALLRAQNWLREGVLARALELALLPFWDDSYALVLEVP
jgi:hypothetical protein